MINNTKSSGWGSHHVPSSGRVVQCTHTYTILPPEYSVGILYSVHLSSERIESKKFDLLRLLFCSGRFGLREEV